jgi:hypothetical protein
MGIAVSVDIDVRLRSHHKVPSNISKARLHKAFNEGRRSANADTVENPYDNSKLRRLWEQGRTQQRAGEVRMPIPALEHGETRAVRPPHNPPGPKHPSRPTVRRRTATGFDGSEGPRVR